MMTVIGNWVLQEACRRRFWPGRAGLNFSGRLSINIAAQQIEAPVFPIRLMKSSVEGLEPRLFRLELTEIGMMKNIRQSIGMFTS